MDSDGSSTVAVTFDEAVDRTAWTDHLSDLDNVVRETVDATLALATSSSALRQGEVSLHLTDDDGIRTLNRDYRAKDRPTNVLSFPSLDLILGKPEVPLPPGLLLLGDVVISLERLRIEANEQGLTFNAHFRHLLIHGTLHLLGFDHESDDEAVLMERLEVNILAGFGLSSPYRDDDDEEPPDGGQERSRDMAR